MQKDNGKQLDANSEKSNVWASLELLHVHMGEVVVVVDIMRFAEHGCIWGIANSNRSKI